MAMVLWSRAGILPGGDATAIRVITWVLVAYFTFGIALNALSRSRAERVTAAPACLLLSVASLVLALGT